MRRYLEYKVFGDPYSGNAVFADHEPGQWKNKDTFWVIHQYHSDWLAILNGLQGSPFHVPVQLLDQGVDPFDQDIDVYDGSPDQHHIQHFKCMAVHLPRPYNFAGLIGPGGWEPIFLGLYGMFLGGIPIWAGGNTIQGHTPPVISTSFNYPPWLAGISA